MKIEFSRHSKRRMKLYSISEEIVINLINHENIKEEGKYEIIKRVETLSLPIKIVFIYEEDKVVVITAYPLKRGLNENIL